MSDTVIELKSANFGVGKQCSSETARHFRGIFSLYHQGRRVNQPKYQPNYIGESELSVSLRTARRYTRKIMLVTVTPTILSISVGRSTCLLKNRY
jgi:hypothetical protein